MVKFGNGIRKAILGSVATLGVIPALASAHDYTVEVDLSDENAVEMKHYWKSTGWSPSDLYRTPDFQTSMDYLATTRGGFDYVRPHYMLDLIEVSTDEDGNDVYDFTHFDNAVDMTVERGIGFDFEWMGNPGGRFNGYKTEEQVAAWRGFVRMVTQRLVDRYGAEEIRSWLFETSNEPDIHPFWVHGTGEFLNYYDATRAGMRDVLPELNLGGPANGRFISPILKSWLEHLSENHPDDPPAFISSHNKAQPYMQARYEEWLNDYLKEKHPEFLGVPQTNNEADPIGGWGVPYWWRAGPWHAAYFAQQIDVHNRKLIDQHGINYVLLGNDHGFMGSWGQRTLFARFVPGDNGIWQKGSGDTGGWKPFDQTFDNDPRPLQDHYFLVKKPVLTVKSMLSMLGKERFTVEGFPETVRGIETYESENKNIGCLATKRPDTVVAVVCFNRPEMNLNTGLRAAMEPSEEQLAAWAKQNGSVTINLKGLTEDYDRLVEIRLDNENGNPYGLWQRMGSPDDLSDEQFNQLAANQEPVITNSASVDISDGTFSQSIDLPSSSVSMFLLMPDDVAKPTSVKSLSVSTYTGETGSDVALLQWAPPAEDVLLTYEVQYRASRKQAYTTLNASALIGHDFTHVPTNGAGEYRVRSVSFDGKTSGWSSIKLD